MDIVNPESMIANEAFAPRTRTATTEKLTALKPVLAIVEANPSSVYTIATGMTAGDSASLVSLLNEHLPNTWTFGARTTPDGTAIVQAKYDPANLRPVRVVNRKPKTDAPAKPKSK